MKLNILLCTSENRGDHAADVKIAHEVKTDETVEELATRLFDGTSDVIEIRMVLEGRK